MAQPPGSLALLHEDVRSVIFDLLTGTDLLACARNAPAPDLLILASSRSLPVAYVRYRVCRSWRQSFALRKKLTLPEVPLSSFRCVTSCCTSLTVRCIPPE